MHWLIGLAGLLLIITALGDGFEVMVLPRRASRRFRPTRLFYRLIWPPWSAAGRRIRNRKRRESFLAIFGPLSLLMLLAFWATLIISGYALAYFALRASVHDSTAPSSYFDFVYLSGVTFFTVGYGDVTPVTLVGRLLSIVEAGTGFGFITIVIGYVPVLSQAFSRRETNITLLDARAGTPPSAGQILLRLGERGNLDRLKRFLEEWENWAADLMESHLSFPMLAYYRSQHDNQSWVAAQMAVLDVCALILACGPEELARQARLTFAMARHAAVDMALIFNTSPKESCPERFPPDTAERLRQALDARGMRFDTAPEALARLAELRHLYEPFLQAIADNFLFEVPPFFFEKKKKDNWETTAWQRPGDSSQHLG